ncbi:asparagine synthase-related protein [Hoeflea sp. CAU 1731]
MTTVLERRGPDRTGHWSGERVCLGHTLLATTPEAIEERLPFQHRASGCVITADVRLDNRDDLIGALGLVAGIAIVGDGELILLAYLKWGKNCLDHLVGDFAFAIWDPAKEQIFCARDHFGMRPLVYLEDHRDSFAFASEPASILALDGVNRSLNESKIGDYLLDLEAYDPSSTFFCGIRRLPPAHFLVADGSTIKVQSYWRLQPRPILALSSDQAYAEAFYDALERSVRCRLRSPDPVGAMLSGGMDSGSVVAVASDILRRSDHAPLKTFSAINSAATDCMETQSIFASLTMKGLDPYLVDCAHLEPNLDDLKETLLRIEEPWDGEMTLPRAVYIAARKAGAKTVLDGAAGDVVLNHGRHIARLFREGRWRQAWRDAIGEQRFWGPAFPAWKTFIGSARKAFLPEFLLNTEQQLRWYFTSGARKELSSLNPEFVRRNRLDERLRNSRLPSRRDWKSPSAELADMIVHPNLTVGRERYDRVASSLGIEPRDPLLDLRLVELCVSLPGDQRERDGWPKYVMRNAMIDHLPSSVVWRRGKEHLGGKFTEALWAEMDDLDKCGVENAGAYPYAHFHSSTAATNHGNRKLDFFALWLMRIKQTKESSNGKTETEVFDA